MVIHVIMYHYIRNNEDYEYDVYCRRKSEFKDQINFFIKNYHHCSLADKEETRYFLQSKDESFLLTFDDGYKEHLDCARFLKEKGVSGIFFPSCNVFEKRLLDVNLIHLILGNRKLSIDKLLEDIQLFIDKNNIKIKSNIFKYFGTSIKEYMKVVKPKRYQDIKTSAIKFLLQRDIADNTIRRKILDELFKKYYKESQEKYAKNFYLTIDDMYEMKNLGSCFGGHGISHKHLDSLNKNLQRIELEGSINKLLDLKLIDKNETKKICYPYGAHNNDTLEIMNNKKIDFGFTVEENKAMLDSKHTIHNLPRWDTNNWWNSILGKPEIPAIISR